MRNVEENGANTCASLLQELELIWEEVGESEVEREEMLVQLEDECLQVYRHKVEQASHERVSLLTTLARSEAELSSLVSRLGISAPSLIGLKSERHTGTLKEQLIAIQPPLEDLRWKQEDRLQQFMEVRARIQQIAAEIAGQNDASVAEQPSLWGFTSEDDLSMRRLDEYHAQLQVLQREKSNRLRKVLEHVHAIHGLCAVLGKDFFKTVADVHSSLDESTPGQPKSISNDTLNRLAKAVESLQREKMQQIHKLQHLGASLLDLWNLMDTPLEERELFAHVTCTINMSEDEVYAPGALTLDNVEEAQIEVERLDELKANRTKELVLMKQEELDGICREAHMDPDPNAALEKIMAVIDSGLFDPSEVLVSMDHQIIEAKEEALSRKEITEKVGKWLAACKEERWLEDYSRDQSRYNASRGAHLNLRRAERARVTVNKLSALGESLVAKTRVWEEEHGLSFVYDGVPLLVMLDDYNYSRQEKEEEKQRARDNKKLQEQLMTEQAAILGSRPSPNKPPSAKKNLGARNNGPGDVSVNRRLSLAGGTQLQPGSIDMLPLKVTPV